MTHQPTTQRRDWVIWNADYHQFWGPDSGGYFGLWGAGLYTEADAKRLSSNKDRRDQAHHISEYRDQINNMRGAFERLSSALDASARGTAAEDAHKATWGRSETDEMLPAHGYGGHAVSGGDC